MSENIDALKQTLLEHRLDSYAQLRGGYSIPLAGAVYWAVLAGAGLYYELSNWAMIAFWGSGAIFPLALLLSKVLRNPFMKSKTAIGDLLVPTFIGMLLFWPMIFGAAQIAPELIPLILAIGMSIHWPVIGWTYGRTGIYAGHAIVRAVLVTWIWAAMPDARLTLLPLAVAGVYLATVIIILIDSSMVRRRLAL